MAKKKVEKKKTVKAPVEKPKEKKDVEKAKKTPLTDEQKMALERELRKYVKKTGGFRKDLPEQDKQKALRIMKRLGRKEPKWDTKIVIPGYDLPEGEA